MATSESCSAFDAVRQLLTAMTVGEFPKPVTACAGDSTATSTASGVIETTSDTPLRDVVTLLLRHNISSCPVRRADHKEKDGQWIETYIGVVDLLDIVAFVLAIMKVTSKWGKGFEAVLEAVVQFAEHTVEDVMKASPAITFQPIETTSSIADALKLLGKDRYHRAIVIDSNTKQLHNIITQSSMLRFIAKSAETSDAIKAFTTQSLAQLGLARPQKLFTLPVSQKAVDAFNLIQRHRVTGVPIVDSEGNLVGNVSARDIRSMVGAPEKFDRLFDTLSEFLLDIAQDKAADGSATVPCHQAHHGTQEEKEAALWSLPPAITVEREDTLDSVISKILTHRVHRVYIVEKPEDGRGNGKPVGVVTQTDILRLFSEGVLSANARPRNSISQFHEREEAAAALATVQQ